MIHDRRVINSDFKLISDEYKVSPYAFTSGEQRLYDMLAEDAGKALRKSQAYNVSPELQNAKDNYERALTSYKIGANRIAQAYSVGNNDVQREGRAELNKGRDYMKRADQELKTVAGWGSTGIIRPSS